MIIWSYISIVGVILITLLTYYYLKKYGKGTTNFVQILFIVFAIVFFCRFMWQSDSIEDCYFLSSPFSDNKMFNLLSLLFNWLVYASAIILVLLEFFQIKGKDLLVKFFAFPVYLLSAIIFFVLAQGILGASAFEFVSFRLILMCVEFGFGISLGYMVLASNNYFKVEKEDLKILWCLPIILMCTMPSYMLKGLFGYVNYGGSLKDLNVMHRIILYIGFLLPVALYFLLRHRSADFKRWALLFISIGGLMSFSVNYKFPDLVDITHLPFHLCNTAMYIIVLCLIFRWKKLFYFTYFINVLGTLLAMFMPNYSGATNLFSVEIVVFYINHYIAFFMPILIVALRVYPRPRAREFVYSIVWFAVYFALVLILNAWFSNYGSVDYFFLNSNFIAEKLGKWAENLRSIDFQFYIGSLSFTFYPIYQGLFFLVYVALGGGVWFVFEWAYTFVDMFYDIARRKEKIKLGKLAILSISGGMDLPMDRDNCDKLILDNFSKRYGKSDVYAVKDANLVIKSGEIFGFLGHNGAGKSTIIKSIVGIQPITSGSIQVCGYDVDKQPKMVKSQIGFVPDHYALYEKLTGREYINYIADLFDVSGEDRERAINKYVDLFELGGAFDNQIKTYSHGMKQKIAIMSALVHNPRVWILDEPLTGLDPSSIYQVKACMKEHAKRGNIVFFSSHLIDIVEQLCDRIAIIKKGKILTCEYVKDIEKDCSLEEYYLKITRTNVQTYFYKENKNISKKFKGGQV